MCGTVLAILAISSIASAQEAPRDHYRELCKPPKDGKSYEDGYEVEYSCDSAGDSERLLDTVTISTPEECAMLCKENSACKGSDWFYGTETCNIYISDDVVDEVLGSVLIRRITPPEEDDDSALKDDLQDELDECRKGLKADKEACDKKIKELEDKLSKCTGNLRKCNDDLSTCQADLTTCHKQCEVDPVWERRKEAMKICGYGGRKTITAGAYTYRAFSQRQVAYGKFYKQLAIGVDECLAD
ncbi:hypothetical protein N7488_005143 [Penicillium malachiteum]|nr:hypothetical protein N7488_005143 [Penicillium malachiteum]